MNEEFVMLKYLNRCIQDVLDNEEELNVAEMLEEIVMHHQMINEYINEMKQPFICNYEDALD